ALHALRDSAAEEDDLLHLVPPEQEPPGGTAPLEVGQQLGEGPGGEGPPVDCRRAGWCGAAPCLIGSGRVGGELDQRGLRLGTRVGQRLRRRVRRSRWWGRGGGVWGAVGARPLR